MEQKLYICRTEKIIIMDLETRKYEFIQRVFSLNENLFEKLESLLKKETKEPKRISIEQYNKEIDEAILQVKNGEFYTQEEVEKMAEKW
jgi:hypothetical protein